MPKILVVDDEVDMLETIAYNLERAGHEVVRAGNSAQALSRLVPPPDLIISDVMMPGMDGLGFCREVRSRKETALTPFLFVTARGQAGDKFEGLRAGADDYVTKPFDLPDLLARVNGRLQHRATAVKLERDFEGARKRWHESADAEGLLAARREQERIAAEIRVAGYVDYQPPEIDVASLKSKLAQLEKRFPALAAMRATSLVGEAPAFIAQFEEILIAAAGPDPTLVFGEPGTGKTGVAEAIWKLGPRASGPFRTINCAELAAGDPLIAAGKLFGYGRNSGLPNLPREGQAGLLQEADGGVLFLDEIGELPRQAQTLLLLPLERRPFQPAVGTGSPRTVDVKFVCATNRDLPAEVEAGTFPRDLYERLAGQIIRLPALRQRPGDVAALVPHLLREESPAGEPPVRIDPAALEALAAFSWPGNVRQLRNVIRQAAQRARLNQRDAITRADLGPEFQGRPATPTPAASFAAASLEVPGAGAAVAGDAVASLVQAGFAERDAREIVVLRGTRFNVGEAEDRLGYSRKARTLSRRLRGMSFKALDVCDLDVPRAAGLLAGGEPALGEIVVRRLQEVLASTEDGLEKSDDALIATLSSEHAASALRVIAVLRRRKAKP